MPADFPPCMVHTAKPTLAAYRVTFNEIAHAADMTRVARALRAYNQAQLQLYIFVGPGFEQVVLASYGIGERLLTLTLRADSLRASDVETLQEMLPREDESGTVAAARYGKALDRTRVTQRFFADFAAQRDMLARAWTGLPAQARRERDQLSLLLLSRLMFLYFLQHRDQLAGNRNYLPEMVRAWQRATPRKTTSFYRARLTRLFFLVLNRKPERRPRAARCFGDLPYLNGGLFDRHQFERKYRTLDLPDSAIANVFDDLLERYRFTAREASDAQLDGVDDVGVDPEMLGRVFEGLMAEKQRSSTGTFYTPARTVDRLVCESLCAYLAPHVGSETAATIMSGNCHDLDIGVARNAVRALERVRVLDPACGSGAFLLGSLSRIAQTRATLEQKPTLPLRRAIVAQNLFGVDLQNDAAQLCALRLWLALVPERPQETVQPLPNLDRQIRQGDTLVDPLDLNAGITDAAIRKSVASITPLTLQYSGCEPEQRAALLKQLRTAERLLTRQWLSAERTRIDRKLRELKAWSNETDLFGEVTSTARAAVEQTRLVHARAAELRRISRRAQHDNEQPFFSFGIHFGAEALAGFDMIICNPPWVRAHKWTGSLSAVVRQRFRVCQHAPWRAADVAAKSPAAGNQVDLAMLFLERCIELLAPGGILGIILPAKFMRSLSGAGARRLLLETTEILLLEDHSLNQKSIFEAAAFTTILVARKIDHARNNAITTHLIKRVSPVRSFHIPKTELPLLQQAGSPWLVAPPEVRKAMRAMQEHPVVGARAELLPRRGVVSGANDVVVLTQFKPKLAGLAEIRAQGYGAAGKPASFEAVIESECVAPLVRGCDVRAWSAARERFIICRSPASTPRRTLQYLSRHNARMPAMQKSTTHLLAWHDLANNLNATVLSPGVVPLNTVYFIPLAELHAHVLCAYFNSLPVRTFARAIAERAKDAHFRFFAWTMALLPLPAHWKSFEAGRLAAISKSAHEQGCITEDEQSVIDEIVARSFALERTHVNALAAFDTWLRS